MGSKIVLTTYLTQRIDPQRKRQWLKDDDATVETWIRSLERVGLRGIIFHDGLSNEFADRWTSKAVEFMPVTWQTPWTAAEERVKIYLNWLALCRYDWVLTTDLSDVEFYRDPFEIIDDPAMLYIGSETETIGEVIIMQDWMKRSYGKITDREKVILNPGIVGGGCDLMMDFLGRWMMEMQQAIEPTPPPHDIVAFNRLIYREQIHYKTGWPLHTTFRQNESPESGAAIRHK